MEITKKNKIKESTSKRLNSLPKTYKTYDLDYKKEIIKEVGTNGDEREVAKLYGINPKTVHRWVTKGFKKYKGGGRKIRDPAMEKKLLSWFDSFHNKNGNKVTTKLFKKMALYYSKDGSFRASKGWLQKFRKRHNIQLN